MPDVQMMKDVIILVMVSTRLMGCIQTFIQFNVEYIIPQLLDRFELSS